MWPQIILFGNHLPFQMRNTLHTHKHTQIHTPRTESFPLIYCLLCVISWEIRKSSCEDFHIQPISVHLWKLCCYNLWLFFRPLFHQHLHHNSSNRLNIRINCYFCKLAVRCNWNEIQIYLSHFSREWFQLDPFNFAISRQLIDRFNVGVKRICEQIGFQFSISFSNGFGSRRFVNQLASNVDTEWKQCLLFLVKLKISRIMYFRSVFQFEHNHACVAMFLPYTTHTHN